MYFLIWIYETCQPGRMIGPMELTDCNKKMLQRVKESRERDHEFLVSCDYVEDQYYVNTETGEGFYIVKSEKE